MQLGAFCKEIRFHFLASLKAAVFVLRVINLIALFQLTLNGRFVNKRRRDVFAQRKRSTEHRSRISRHTRSPFLLHFLLHPAHKRTPHTV